MINERYTLIVEVGKGIAAIRCHACDKASYNHYDIEHRYCGFCHQFHHDTEIYVRVCLDGRWQNVPLANLNPSQKLQEILQLTTKRP